MAKVNNRDHHKRPKSASKLVRSYRSRPTFRGFLVLVSLVGFPLWCVLAIVVDRMGLRPLPSGTYDAIVVAGCRVLPDGSPSRSLERRARKAVELWQRGLAPIIAFTGGVGPYPPSEAAAAAKVALRLGVPESALVLEERSTSTLENALYLRKLVTFARIIVVTDSYHVRRCESVFGRQFKDVRGVGVKSPLWDRASGALREVIAIMYHGVMESLGSSDSS